MNPELEATGTTEEIANEIAKDCVRMESYTPDRKNFELWIEFESFCRYNSDFELTYQDYKSWLIWKELKS